MCRRARRTIVAAMTETLLEPPPAPPPPDPRRLVRDPDDKVLAGVCAGFGRYTDTDPVLWRVAVAVLTLFGGAGLALYALGWLMVPRVGEPQSVAERVLRRPGSGVTTGGVVLAVVVAVVLLAVLDDGPGLGALAVIGGLAFLVSRERRDAVTPPAAGPAPLPADGDGLDGPPEQPVAWAAPRPPKPPRERSPLGLLTLSAAAVVAGVLLVLRAAGVDGITAPRVLAAALLVVGAGLLVGTWHGRARWLIAPGVVLALALGATAAVGDTLEDGVGERTWRAADGSSYALGVGEGVLDLRTLRGVDDAQVRAEVGVGQLTVLVPEDLVVRITGDVDFGQLTTVELDGDRRDFAGDEPDDVNATFVVGTSGAVTADIDLEVGMGLIEVRRVAS